jgi:hypothetical protein
MKHFLPATLLLASCGGGGSPDIRITDAWVRETIAGQSTSAAYMTIANEGSASDRLVGVEAPAPAAAMVHETSSADGIARMRALETGLEIPAGAAAQLKPGGTHVMVTGLAAPLAAGGVLRLKLRFEKSGERAIAVPVKGAI